MAVKTLDDVTLSFHTLGEVDLEARASAASAAGFRSIGLSIRRTRAWLQDHPLAQLTDILGRHDLVVGELEALRPLGAEPDEHEDFALGLALDLGTPLIQLIGPADGSVGERAARLARLAERAANQGVRLALEFLPWTNVPTVTAAAEIVSAAGWANAGVCVDVWHLYRSGGSVDDLGPLWPYVASIQLDDGPLVPDIADDLHLDCLHHRLLPGEGAFDLVSILADAGSHAPTYALSIEVISDRLAQLPTAEAAQLAASTTSRTLAAVEESYRV